jgi:glycosyltransferase involved in cell wall biosynthesis
MRMEPRVEVLLATYNGERFLREQVESILGQVGVEVRVVARDDGSADGTAGILREYAEKMPERFRVVETGVASGSAKGNFLELMKAAEAEYVCFADQDDVWLPGKVERAVTEMRRLEEAHGVSAPLMVFGDLQVVDEGLGVMCGSMRKQMGIVPESVNRLARLVGQSVVTGCTMTINRPMLELAKRMPEEATMHDRWIGLLAAAMGWCGIVWEAMVLYRQHAANVIGAVAADDSVSGTVKRVRGNEGRRLERWRSERMVEALLRVHGTEIPAEKVEVLRAYLRSGRSASAVERVGLTMRYGFWRGTVMRDGALLVDLARARSDEGFG